MIRKNQIVAVQFLDHVESASHPLRFILYGRVASHNAKSITVDSWCYADKKTSYDSRNVTRHTIVRSAIEKITLLKEAK